MKKGRKLLGLLVVLLLVLTVIGCGDTKTVINTEEETEERVQIGMSFDSFVIERWQKDRDVFVSAANTLGADVNVQIANGEVEEQIAQIEYFIDKNMDVIVIIATDSEALSGVVAKAKSQGIKIIAYDRLIKNADIDLYLSFDNRKVGTIMAQTLIENNPDGGDVIAAYGPMTDYNVEMMMEGFCEEINNSNLSIVYSDHCEAWRSEEALEIVTKGLGMTDNLVGVVCGNDDLASQAMRALSEERLAGKVTLVGQDADLMACQRIVEGTQTMTVFKRVEDLAEKAAEYAVKLARNQEIDVQEVIYNGKKDVIFEKLDPTPVTIKNLEEVIINSGFHYKEDIYLNINE